MVNLKKLLLLSESAKFLTYFERSIFSIKKYKKNRIRLLQSTRHKLLNYYYLVV